MRIAVIVATFINCYFMFCLSTDSFIAAISIYELWYVIPICYILSLSVGFLYPSKKSFMIVPQIPYFLLVLWVIYHEVSVLVMFNSW